MVYLIDYVQATICNLIKISKQPYRIRRHIFKSKCFCVKRR